MRILLCLLFVFSIGQAVQAQYDSIIVVGNIFEFEGGNPMNEAEVQVLANGIEVQSLTTNIGGVFKAHCGFDNEYELVFSRDGFISKRIAVDTRQIPNEEKASGGFEVMMRVTLFRIPADTAGLDYSIFDDPIGRFAFDELSREFINDTVYAKQVDAKLQEMYIKEQKYQAEHGEIKVSRFVLALGIAVFIAIVFIVSFIIKGKMAQKKKDER